MKITTNYGLDGKVTMNFGTKDLPICTNRQNPPSPQGRQPNRKEVLNHGT